MNIRFTQRKIMLLLFSTSVMIFIHNISVIVVIFLGVMVASLAITHRIDGKARLKAMGAVALFVLIFQILFHTDISIQERIFVGIIMALRLITLSFLVFLFTETTSVSEIVASISFLPKKLCLMLTISFALLPCIITETQAIRIAQQSRGLQTKGLNIFRSLFPIIIPLVHRTLARAEHIAVVLETRGFDADKSVD
jgi:energy-coupling factor transport system permease protein